MKKIKRFLILLIVFLMLWTTPIFAEKKINQKNMIYGNVYVFTDDAPLYYYIISNFKTNDLLFLKCQPIVLVNKGKVIDIGITSPLDKSYIIIGYKHKLYRFALKPYKVYSHCIIWTFSGGG